MPNFGGEFGWILHRRFGFVNDIFVIIHNFRSILVNFHFIIIVLEKYKNSLLGSFSLLHPLEISSNYKKLKIQKETR